MYFDNNNMVSMSNCISKCAVKRIIFGRKLVSVMRAEVTRTIREIESGELWKIHMHLHSFLKSYNKS